MDASPSSGPYFAYMHYHGCPSCAPTERAFKGLVLGLSSRLSFRIDVKLGL